VENERHIDLFADLNLGLSDDEDGINNDPGIVHEGVAQMVPLLPRSQADTGPAPLQSHESHIESSAAGTPPPPSKRKGKRKKATKASNNKMSPWAEKCMYAELLEMHESEDFWAAGGEGGLPGDLETGWVALAPVPVGKRCLAIAHQGGGIIGAGASIG
jgi:snurportin-1